MAGQGSPGTQQAVERRVLDVLGGLLSELGQPRAAEEPGAEAPLDTALGLGSLERVELLLRLERAFGVTLPDDAVARATCARALSRLVAEAHPSVAEAPPALHAAQAPARAAPEFAPLLTDVLRWHAEVHPERTHLFLREDDGTERPLTYGTLWARASGVAAALVHEGVERGEPVALMLRTEVAFFSCFFGALLAGGIPVPLYPPVRMDRLEEYVGRQVGILRNASPRVLVTFDEARGVGALLKARVSSLRRTRTPRELEWVDASAPAVHVEEADGALIQYTSGSTGAPKGVLLTHGQLLANIRAIGRALRVGPEDVGVSWLPLYHDMGLIGSWLMPLTYGIPVTFLSPLAFLARPARWLHALHAHRGTLSAAPNFAYDLCVKLVRDEELEGLDLSAWRVALNGSESVSAETLECFTRRFAPYGLKAGALLPAYGLAEAAVALTFPPPGRPPRIDAIAREPFERKGEARPAAETPRAQHFVSCGSPLPGYAVRIVDERGRPMGERVRGHIEFQGPSMTSGYYNNPVATMKVLRGGWMDSGDLGYLADGELYVTGRSKELIIKAGRNLYPSEIEEVVGEVPGVRKGRVAAFGQPDPRVGTERLVVVAETRERSHEARERLRAAIVERVVEVLELPPDEVVLVSPGAVRKTSSGKLRRGATREAWMRGALSRGPGGVWAQFARLAASTLRARAGRLLGTAGAAAYTGYFTAVVSLAALVLEVALWVTPAGPRTDRLVRRGSRWLLRGAGCPVRVDGEEHLRAEGPWVLVARHVSYLDSVVLLAVLPVDFRAVAQREAGSWPVVGRAMRQSGHLLVDRFHAGPAAEAAERASRLLQAGTSLLVFPEGTRARGPGMLPLKLGAFKAAVEAGRPLVPVHIAGTRRIWPRGKHLLRPGRITVVIGEPLVPEGEGWPEMVRLRERTREELSAGALLRATRP
ncbi:AMP-binding protein [Pyxidicoccus sp. MSG2]|uniref:AMP-binding protein n=1 Tax=Pyxidicoccus sp. MSG2 TaxID=2996790 RepID=UPI002270CD36|nr:AMP-binding protein [Pyxidicoccus sp. MSG2]MCY1015832.1 AMP-binding protein [Pyxidicoccus sp. MSG2]